MQNSATDSNCFDHFQGGTPINAQPALSLSTENVDPEKLANISLTCPHFPAKRQVTLHNLAVWVDAESRPRDHPYVIARQ